MFSRVISNTKVLNKVVYVPQRNGFFENIISRYEKRQEAKRRKNPRPPSVSVDEATVLMNNRFFFRVIDLREPLDLVQLPSINETDDNRPMSLFERDIDELSLRYRSGKILVYCDGKKNCQDSKAFAFAMRDRNVEAWYLEEGLPRYYKWKETFRRSRGVSLSAVGYMETYEKLVVQNSTYWAKHPPTKIIEKKFILPRDVDLYFEGF